MRGHGASITEDDLSLKALTLDLFCEDLLSVLGEVVRCVGRSPVHTVTHSFSGILVFRLGSSLSSPLWQKLVAFDPPIYPHDDPTLVKEIEERVNHRMAQFRRKQVNWPDADAYLRKLQSIPALKRWEEQALKAYACTSLTTDETGFCKLACHPDLEARIFRIAMDPSTSRALPNYRGDVLLVSADGEVEKKSWSNRVQANVESRLPSCERIVLQRAHHMMIFERPEECAELVREFLGRK